VTSACAARTSASAASGDSSRPDVARFGGAAKQYTPAAVVLTTLPNDPA